MKLFKDLDETFECNFEKWTGPNSRLNICDHIYFITLHTGYILGGKKENSSKSSITITKAPSPKPDKPKIHKPFDQIHPGDGYFPNYGLVKTKFGSSNFPIGDLKLDRTADFVFKEFSGFYHRLSMEIVSGNYTRHREKWPIGFAFLDFDGTKNSGFFKENQRAGPHAHAVLMVHPDSKDKCDQFISSVKLKKLIRSWRHVKAFNMQHFDPEEASLKGLISYSSKFLTKSTMDHYRVYPERSPSEPLNGG